MLRNFRFPSKFLFHNRKCIDDDKRRYLIYVQFRVSMMTKEGDI